MTPVRASTLITKSISANEDNGRNQAIQTSLPVSLMHAMLLHVIGSCYQVRSICVARGCTLEPKSIGNAAYEEVEAAAGEGVNG